ncbi:hypothetical protein B0F90DRAFT_1669328 [Multifurca ochricompacta]|uniref:DUF6699 domain-containing protein n=1 Tax=Multifurca ochricompacta TaxID=376703 RepID=A0AAD4QM47_9AGAM|nr:hypothetical protein B0F90DRAFT_1669328 [Multifurca ochricompacta]
MSSSRSSSIRGSGGGGVPPTTPVLSPVGLDAVRVLVRVTISFDPGAPHMGTVPLPFLQQPQHSLPTPPVSPERPRYTVLSELLVYTGHRPAKLNFNVVQPPSAACLHPSCNPNMMNEPAISTRAPCLVLEIPGISGGSFYASNAHGHAVTVREVLYAVHAKMSERSGQTEYHQLPSEQHRRAASASFAQRNRVTPDPAGLRRFDLLGGLTTFAGLQRAANGADVWIVRFI